MAVTRTNHGNYTINVPFNRAQKLSDSNQVDFIIIEDVDGNGVVVGSNSYTNIPLLIKVLEDGSYSQITNLPSGLTAFQEHRNLENVKVYMKDGETFVETSSGGGQTAVSRYAFGNSNDELYLEFHLTNNTLTAYAF